MRPGRGSLTFWSAAALVGGLGLGLVGHLTGGPLLAAVGEAAKVLGRIWLSALQLVTLPLALALTLSAITHARVRGVGAMTLRAMGLYATVLLAMGFLTLGMAWAFLRPFPVAPGTALALSKGITVPAEAIAASAPAAGDWLGSLVPSNLFEAAVRGQIFPLLLFVMVLALAVTRLPDDQRFPLARGFHALAQAMMVLVHWILVVTPIGVFALGYVLALETGASLAGILGGYLLIQPAVTMVWLLLLYPLTAALGRVPVGAFARAVLPAQLVAASTRSSAAALPALVEGGRQHLALPETATGFLLPLSVSLFRISVGIQDSVKLVFLAHVYGIALTPAVVGAFVATVCLLSFSSTGIPNSGGGSSFRMVPVFVAAGVPIEGVILLEVVETIPDIFATVANVTGQMSATTILSRWSARRESEAAPA